MPKKFGALFIFASSITLTSIVATPPSPSAKEILASVRMQQAQQQIDLQGQLRENDKIIPFRITQTGPIIRYTFTNPDEVLQLRLEENGSRLDLVKENGTEKFASSRLDQKIRETGVSYGDLALKFLYWPNARVAGEDAVDYLWRGAGVARLGTGLDPGGHGMRMEGYDWNGQLAKRFEVISAQKIDDRWFLKQMRIEEVQPGTNKVQSRTYLEIKK